MLASLTPEMNRLLGDRQVKGYPPILPGLSRPAQ
jgi:hypothetical protein